MSERLIETYLDALVAGDWDTFAGCLADDGFTRVGPFGDVKPTKAEYVAFLTELMPTLPGYSMDVTRVTYSGSLAFAELSETVEVDGTPLRTPECLTFELSADGERIRRVEVFTQTRAAVS
jgi:ketosteroid isomerase-like protein